MNTGRTNQNAGFAPADDKSSIRGPGESVLHRNHEPNHLNYEYQFHFFGLNANSQTREMILPYLKRLDRQISISSAVVVPDHPRNGSPAYAVRVRLTVRGPDNHAEARDHTLQAAWHKVWKNLEKQIGQRQNRREARATQEGGKGLKMKRGFLRACNRVFCPIHSAAHS